MMIPPRFLLFTPPSISLSSHTFNSYLFQLIINMKLSILSVGLLAGAVAAVPTATTDSPIVKRATLNDVSFHILLAAMNHH